MKSSPRSPQLEKALMQQRRPNTAKNKIKFKKILIKKKIYYLTVFMGLEFQSWVVWLRSSHEVAGASAEGLTGTTESISTPVLLHGYWQEASVSHCT